MNVEIFVMLIYWELVVEMLLFNHFFWKKNPANSAALSISAQPSFKVTAVFINLLKQNQN